MVHIEWTTSGYVVKDGIREYIIKPGYFDNELSEKFEGVIENKIVNGIKNKIELKSFRVVDLNDNELGLASTIEEAKKIFKERYTYWEGDCDMFIEENKKSV